MADFDIALALVFKLEGGESDHPDDQGGKTRYGISQAKHTLPETRDDAAKIYHDSYWLVIRGGDIKCQKAANSLLALAVHVGHRKGVALAQAACGAPVDGWCGPVTLAAINRMNSELFCLRLMSYQLHWYQRICDRDKTQRVFLRGWLRRALSAYSQ